VSWQVGAILFAIGAFEGVRRLEPEDLLLRCNPLGSWRVVSPIQLWRDWYLVSVLPPFFLTIVARHEAGAKLLPDGATDIQTVAGSIEPILALRLLGALDFLLIVFGVPWGISYRGSAGLLAFLGCALVLSAAITLRLAAVRFCVGEARWAAFRSATSFLSPFASPFAAESALSSLLQSHARIAVISDLLGEAKFRALIRPAAYDVELRQSAIGGSFLADIALALPRSERVRILESAGEGCTKLERFCPRCAERYSLASISCADCDGIALSASS
jgi:hypothetical protein